MKNVIRWCLDNPVAVNLTVIITCLAGFVFLGKMNRELFPEFSLDRIIVSVVFPGASPEEVEEGICIKVEEAINGIVGIKRVESSARESVGTIVIEIEAGEDIYRMKDRIESQINQINTFPETAEKPLVRDLTLVRQVLFVSVSGDMSEENLRTLSEEVKDEILQYPEISQAYIAGLRDYEISIELSEETMKRYGVSSVDVGNAIRRNSIDMSGGVLKTKQGEVLLRVKGQKYVRRDFEDIIIKTNADGANIYLHQIAQVKDSFEESRVRGYLNGKRAALINISKTSEEDIIKIADRVRAYINEKQKTLPNGIKIGIIGDTSVAVQSRLDLLSSNALQGLILVFICLALSLDLRLAFWVVLGMPISFLGTFVILVVCGQTLNMLSMFSLIICLGIIVDDSIVISESIHSHLIEHKLSPKEAAHQGTVRVFWPVIACVTTTVVAFLPLYAVPGIMGKFIAVIPTAVVATLLLSLVEALVALPSHLSNALRERKENEKAPWTEKLSGLFDAWVIKPLISGYIWLLRLAGEYRYVTICVAICMLLSSFAMVQAGYVKFILFSRMDSEQIVAKLTYPEGTSDKITEPTIRHVEKCLWQVNAELKKEYNLSKDLIVQAYTVLGQHTDERGSSTGSNLAEVNVELLASEERPISSDIIVVKWREIVGKIPGITSLSIDSAEGGPGGKAIQVQFLSNNFTRLRMASNDLKRELQRYPGLFDIQDDFKEGYKELRFALKPSAQSLGISLSELATQIRYAVYGNEVLRIQRGKFDVRVYLRFPEEERQYISDMEKIFIRSAQGQEIPILEVATMQITDGYSLIRRVDGKRIINVMADINEREANASEIIQDLVQTGVLDAITKKYKVGYAFEGQQKESSESLEGLGIGFLMASLAIYTILATIFKSYIQPVIIMFTIPLGFIGVIWGHWIMNYPLTLMSMFGIVALSGIVVDNAVVMIDFINEALRDGKSMLDAVLLAGSKRFRPIFLTSVTTIAGICPLMLGQSLQAQYLIPMAISLGFGLLFSWILTMMFVPALFIILADVIKLIHWFWTGVWLEDKDVYGC